METCGVELTRGAPWEYRAVLPGGARPWRPTLEAALEGLAEPLLHVPWPTEWTAFGPAEAGGRFQPHTDPLSSEVPPPEVLATVPEALPLDGRELRRAAVRADSSGAVDLVPIFGEPRNGRTAYLFAEVVADADGPVTVHAGGDWWMQWWVDGRPVFDTLRSGNRFALLGVAHPFTVALAKGRHVVAVRVVSGAGGWGLASEATRPAAALAPEAEGLVIEARRAFRVADPSGFASLTFVGPEDGRATLNGRDIPVPLPGMRYHRVPAIPVSMLRPGENALLKRWTGEESARGVRVLGLRHFEASGEDARLLVSGALYGLTQRDARVQTGPFINRVGEEEFVLTCRTNMPVSVGLAAGGRTFKSVPALVHHFEVGGLEAATAYPYAVTPAPASPQAAERARSGTVRTLPRQGEIEFAILGDSATRVDVWERIARAVAGRRPALAVFTGDMVSTGRSDARWDEDFFGRARDLLADVPLYAVMGNHEEKCPIFEALFLGSGGGQNWVQEAGDVLLVGLDGALDWSAGGANAAWLEARLRASRAPFVFAFNHYPPWSSAVHGRLGEDGRPVEHPARAVRETIVPMLVAHRATALVAGHDHCYERSELPGGLTLITSGGAGSYLYPNREDPRQNPHSKVFASRFHYCWVRVAEGVCRLEAVADDGQTLDERTWAARA